MGTRKTACLPLLAIACQASAIPVTEPQDSGWVGGYAPAEPVATWSADEVLLAASEAMSLGFPDPWETAELMDAWFSEGDYLCPGPDGVLGDAALEGCDAITEWYYIGVGGYLVEEGADASGSFVSAWLMGDMEILGPDGEALAVGGHWDHLVTVADGLETWEASLSGSWRAEPAELPWLEAGLSSWLWYSGARLEDTGALQSARLHGALAIGETSLYFDELTWSAGCDQPTGALRVRDPSGGWFEKPLSADCEPCGPLMFHGEQITDAACLDLSPVLTSMLATVTR